jgi:hypothetical protein
MTESEIQPKRMPLLRKPTRRRMELMRIMGNEWEYEDSAGARYLELRTDHGDEWFLLVVPKVDQPSKPAKPPQPQRKIKRCCKRFSLAWGRFMDFGRDGIRLKNGDVTIFDKRGQRTRAIRYCPFCGTQIQVLKRG